MAILRLGGKRAAERIRRGVVVAKPRPHFAKRKPCQGKAGRHLDGLRVEVGRAGEIAALFQVLGELETPVGDQVPGGEEGVASGYLSARADIM